MRPSVTVLDASKEEDSGGSRVSMAEKSRGPVEVWQGEYLKSTLNFMVSQSLVQIACKVSQSVSQSVSLSAHVHTDGCADVYMCGAQRLMLGVSFNCSSPLIESAGLTAVNSRGPALCSLYPLMPSPSQAELGLGACCLVWIFMWVPVRQALNQISHLSRCLSKLDLPAGESRLTASRFCVGGDCGPRSAVRGKHTHL